MIISISSGTPGVPEWIRQVGDPLGIPIATVIVAVNVPNMTLSSGRSNYRYDPQYERSRWLRKFDGYGRARYQGVWMPNLLPT